MKKCEECGKTLGIFKGYHHPTMGKTTLLCSKCFDDVNESVTLWREFILSNSFKDVFSKNTFPLTRKNMRFYLSHEREKFDNALIENKF